MGLHNIKRPNVKIKTKRLGKGNGSGYGKTAGRGHKGQKSRSGGNIPAWFEGGQMPIQRRLPKRGFKNRFRTEYRIINLSVFADINENEYDVAKLENLGLIKRCNKNNYMPVKVLGKVEEFNKSITIKVNAFSKTAKEIIEKNGGKAEVI